MIGVSPGYAHLAATTSSADYSRMTLTIDSPPKKPSNTNGSTKTLNLPASTSLPLHHINDQVQRCTHSFIRLCSAFESVPAHQIPPHRRITQDEAPSMMPVPAQNTSHQGNHHGGQPFQSLSKPTSTSSFGSLSGGAAYGQATGGNGTRSRKKARRI